MFQRFTEKARRVIFYARYEAGQYGSSHIESEHLLLGLLREDKGLLWHFMDAEGSGIDIRAEIEKRVTRRECFSTTVEVPLAHDCQRILTLALDESDRLGHQHVGTEHVLLGMLLVESSLAFQILTETGIKREPLREQLATASLGDAVIMRPRPSTIGVQVLETFLAGLQVASAAELVPYFAKNAHVVDSKGTNWEGFDEIQKQFEVLFAPYAKKNVGFHVEKTDLGPAGCLMASIVWENVTVGGQSTRSMHRMTVVLAREDENWVIYLLQNNPGRHNLIFFPPYILWKEAVFSRVRCSDRRLIASRNRKPGKSASPVNAFKFTGRASSSSPPLTPHPERASGKRVFSASINSETFLLLLHDGGAATNFATAVVSLLR
jgi:ketosteroid isomerase-like protein